MHYFNIALKRTLEISVRESVGKRPERQLS